MMFNLPTITKHGKARREDFMLLHTMAGQSMGLQGMFSEWRDVDFVRCRVK